MLLKPLIIFSAFILLSLPSQANTLMSKANEAETKHNDRLALSYYVKAIKANNKNIKALCKASILCSNIGYRLKQKDKQLDYYRAAKTYAAQALAVAPKNADAHFSMAVYYGRIVYTTFLPKARIAYSAKIKHYAEQVLRYNSKHYKAMTLLGMWHYERATLTNAEKKIVSFLGGLPNGSLRQGLSYLNKSMALHPKSIATHLALGKIYIALNKKTSCITAYKKALRLPAQNKNDAERKADIRKRLKNMRAI